MRNIKTIIGAALCFGLLSNCTNGGDERTSLEYLAVQFENGDNWSIIDRDGKVVVKEEYNPDDQISAISPEGAFWVKIGEKYQLFNVHKPKKAVTDTEYDDVTVFAAGRSVVSVQGQPIQVIDADGKVVTTLPKEITQVIAFEPCGLARFEKEVKGKMGCIDRSGNVVFEGEYEDISNFNDGLAYATKKNKEGYDIYDSKGKRVGQFPRGSYELFSQYNGGGLIAARKAEQEVDDPLVFLGIDGKRVFTVKHSNGRAWQSSTAVFRHGYSIFTSKEEKVGIVDDKGEEVVRAKYDFLSNLGNGIFSARKGDKYGVINVKDENIVDFDYDISYFNMLGNNFIMKQDGYWYLIGMDGKEVTKEGFADFSVNPFSNAVAYVDVDALAQLFVNEVEKFDPNVNVGEMYNTKFGLPNPYKRESYSTYIDFTSNLSKDVETEQRYNFDGVLASEQFHEEKENDGWFTYTHKVSDGLKWNNPQLTSIYLESNLSAKKVSLPLLLSSIQQKLQTIGYSSDGTKQVDGKNVRISLDTNENESKLIINWNVEID